MYTVDCRLYKSPPAWTLDKIEYRWLMSSSPYWRVTGKIEIGILAIVLATDIWPISYSFYGSTYGRTSKKLAKPVHWI